MPDTRIGTIVVEFGYCTLAQVQDGLAKRASNQLIGEALVALGYLTQLRLDWVLEYQRTQRQPRSSHARAFVQKQHHDMVNDMKDINSDIRDFVTQLGLKTG